MSVFLCYLEYSCVRVCVCVHACVFRGFLHSVFTHTHLFIFKDMCPIQVCLSRFICSPPSAELLPMWLHTLLHPHCPAQPQGPCAHMPRSLSFSVSLPRHRPEPMSSVHSHIPRPRRSCEGSHTQAQHVHWGAHAC